MEISDETEWQLRRYAHGIVLLSVQDGPPTERDKEEIKQEQKKKQKATNKQLKKDLLMENNKRKKNSYTKKNKNF